MKDDGDDPFPPTDWSMIFRASGPNKTCDLAALTRFIEAYREPVRRCVARVLQRAGVPLQDVEDHCQAFFHELMDKDKLGKVKREEGMKFRRWLVTVVTNFVRDRLRRERSRGAQVTSSAEAAAARGTPVPERIDDLTADRLVQREWALAMLDRALEQLAARHLSGPGAERYRLLRPFLAVEEVPAADYAAIAAQLQVAPKDLYPPMHRLGHELAGLLRRLVMETTQCQSPEEVLAELEELLAYMRGDRRDLEA